MIFCVAEREKCFMVGFSKEVDSVMLTQLQPQKIIWCLGLTMAKLKSESAENSKGRLLFKVWILENVIKKGCSSGTWLKLEFFKLILEIIL